MRVSRPELMARALRHADHDRHLDLAAEHVADRRGVVDDLVHRQQREVDRHQLDHRAQAEHRRAHSHADDRVLRDRRVAHALLAELLEQSGGDLEGALEDADVLAHEEDVLVLVHLLAQGLVEGLAIAHGGHQPPPPWLSRSSPPGSPSPVASSAPSASASASSEVSSSSSSPWPCWDPSWSWSLGVPPLRDL